jgi:hypothetical protein
MSQFKHMSRLAIVALVALLTTTAIAQTATAQQKGRRGGFGGGFGPTPLTSVAANEAVQKEIGASSDLAGKLTTIRDDYRAAVAKEYQTAGINFQDFQNLTAEQRQKMADIQLKLNEEFDPKVKNLVGADSYKRLQQIQLQANLRNYGPSSLTEKSVAAELNLTDDQKQKLTTLAAEFGRRQRELFAGGGGGGFEAFGKLREERTTKTMEVLNDTQKEKLKALQGSPFDVSQLGFGGGRRGKN